MATLPKALINQADIKSAGGVLHLTSELTKSRAKSPLNNTEAGCVLQKILDAKRLVESKGAKFVIIISPSMNVDVTEYDKAMERLKTLASGEHIPLIDMSQLYSSTSSENIYFDGIHLRPLGHKLIADPFVGRIDTLFSYPQ